MDIEDVMAWLEAKRCTLWSDFCIDDEKGRRKAGEWFIKEVDDYTTFLLGGGS